jgi:hypothetical protein
MKKLIEYKNVILPLIGLGFLSYWFIYHPSQARFSAERIFDFALVFAFAIVLGGGLIPQVKEGEQFSGKDIFKLMIFVGIVVFFMGGF